MNRENAKSSAVSGTSRNPGIDQGSRDSRPLDPWKRRSVLPTIEEERWRVIERYGRWFVRYEPMNHPELWRDLAEFASEQEAMRYAKTC